MFCHAARQLVHRRPKYVGSYPTIGAFFFLFLIFFKANKLSNSDIITQICRIHTTSYFLSFTIHFCLANGNIQPHNYYIMPKMANFSGLLVYYYMQKSSPYVSHTLDNVTSHLLSSFSYTRGYDLSGSHCTLLSCTHALLNHFVKDNIL